MVRSTSMLKIAFMETYVNVIFILRLILKKIVKDVILNLVIFTCPRQKFLKWGYVLDLRFDKRLRIIIAEETTTILGSSITKK